MSHFFLDTGINSLSSIWFPLLLWTWLAMILWLCLNWSRTNSPIYQYHVRIALLAALPLGIFSSYLLSLASPLTNNREESLQTTLLMIKNPIPVDSINITGSIAMDWSNPYVWIGYITLLCGLVSLIKVAALFEKYGDLYLIVKNSKTYFLQEVADPDLSLHLNSSNRDILVAFSPLVASPFAFGWRSPVIMLPDTFAKNSTRIKLILLHEGVHIKRADFVLDGIVQIIKSIFWFHPLVWLFAKESALHREISCDADVLQIPSVSAKNYARLLYEMLGTGPPDLLPAIRMVSNPSQLKQRISKMNRSAYHTPAPWRSIILSLLISITLAGLINCSDIQSPRIERIDRINLNKQMLTLEIPRAGETVSLEGYEITLAEFYSLLKEQKNPGTIFHLRAERNGYYISEKLMDVQDLLRKHNNLRISYTFY